MNKISPETHNKIIKHYGSVGEFAEKVGRSRQTVWAWMVGNHYIPVKIAKKVAKETGIKIDELMPDI